MIELREVEPRMWLLLVPGAFGSTSCTRPHEFDVALVNAHLQTVR